jgi:RNA polymerase sigma-70 factor (ECF subfamily)
MPRPAETIREKLTPLIKKNPPEGHLEYVTAAMVLSGTAKALPAFREVFDAHVRYVYRALLFLGVPERHAEDACQEVFVVVSRRLHECESAEHLRSWLYAIAWRVASAHRRKAQNRREVPVEDAGDTLMDSSQEASTSLDERRRWERLRVALDGLPAEQRDVFVLFEIEQLRMREVAETLGCSINTAFSRLYAARKRVAETLGITVPVEVWKR